MLLHRPTGLFFRRELEIGQFCDDEFEAGNKALRVLFDRVDIFEMILRRIIRPASIARFSTKRTFAVAAHLAGHDATQVQLMQERIIVVDENDKPLRWGTKEECHINDGTDKILLHRAFSVFLFDPVTKKLLLQKRASSKITFPSFWANTCCSHPLYEPAEMVEENQVGVKRAAIRKLGHELGISSSELPINGFNYMGTIQYLAPGQNGWGEHEIDHVLAIQAKVNVNPNPNEVDECRWFDEKELAQFMESAKDPNGPKVSPWFAKLYYKFLPKWWADVRANRLKPTSDMTIHRL